MPDPKTSRRIVSAAVGDEDLAFESSLRPRTLADFTGQPKVKEILSIAIEAARLRKEAMDHVLLIGPPGLGKTTLAAIISQELGVPFDITSGPMLQKKVDLTGILAYYYITLSGSICAKCTYANSNISMPICIGK